jgi:mRNA-decapping enzyme subunit 2
LSYSGLDDLCVRFIINLPKEELEEVERICFQVEEAQWFYEDFIRPLDPHLPSLNLRQFCLLIFQHCPLLSLFSDEQRTQAFSAFLTYKTRVPVRGAILLNHDMNEVALVKGWKSGASWSFPRGKINKDEDDLVCAIRETYEETGFDAKVAGLVPVDGNVKYIDITLREQNMRLYVFRDVQYDFPFAPRTRKEISVRLSSFLYYYYFMLTPSHRKSNGTNCLIFPLLRTRISK